MASALEELAKLERLKRKKRLSEGKTSLRARESQRASRAETAMSLESLVEDLQNRTSTVTILRMIEASGVKLSKPLAEAIRRGDTDTEKVLSSFTNKIREAVAKAAEETAEELSR